MSVKINKEKLLQALNEHLEESEELIETNDSNEQEIGVRDCLELYIRKICNGEFDDENN